MIDGRRRFQSTVKKMDRGSMIIISQYGLSVYMRKKIVLIKKKKEIALILYIIILFYYYPISFHVWHFLEHVSFPRHLPPNMAIWKQRPPYVKKKKQSHSQVTRQ